MYAISKKTILYLPDREHRSQANSPERLQELLHQLFVAPDSTFALVLQQLHRRVHFISSDFLSTWHTDVKNFLFPDHRVEVFDHVNVWQALIHAPFDPLPL